MYVVNNLNKMSEEEKIFKNQAIKRKDEWEDSLITEPAQVLF